MALPSVVKWPLRLVFGGLVLVGAAASVLAWMIATPTQIPPPLQSISDGARKIDNQGLPDLQYFQARDQTFLAYRDYQPSPGGDGRIAILAHGSSAQSVEMHAVGKALAAVGVRAIAIDVRGHGHSGSRGDIAYTGQLDDDLADLVAHIRKNAPIAPLIFVGHSLGGGFGLRTAGGKNGDLFASYVLLAPFLSSSAPTSRPSTGAARWAEPNVRRIVALTILGRFGIHCCDHLTAIAYALPERALPFTTREYSYRLLVNYGLILGYQDALAHVRRPITIISGTNDELMIAEKYSEALRRPGLVVHSIVLPGVSHMGVVNDTVALEAIAAAVRGATVN